MPSKIYTSVNSFNSGEISELLFNREDLAKYKSACRKLENAFPLVEGGAKKMPGTYFGGVAGGGAQFLGQISGTTLTVTKMIYGIIQVGQTFPYPRQAPITITALGTGTGGTGTYTISASLRVVRGEFITSALGAVRLVPFQFSTEQGAFLEFSAGSLRIWEPNSPGEWPLGLVEGYPSSWLNYLPATAYVVGNNVLLGCCAEFNWASAALVIASPYIQNLAANIPINITVNSGDTLDVNITGMAPGQQISIALANSTASKNAASAIQTAIQGLGTINGDSINAVDLSNWTVTPNAAYYGTPPIIAPKTATVYPTQVNQGYVCLVNNQNDQSPLTATTYWQMAAPSVVIQIFTPYKEEDLFALDCSTQSADVLYVFHPNYPPAMISRQSANAWSYSLLATRGTAGPIATGYQQIGIPISSITQADPCVVTAPNNSFRNGQRVYINGVAGMENLNFGEFLVSGILGDLFNLVVIDAGTTVGAVASITSQVYATNPNFGIGTSYNAIGGSGSGLTITVTGIIPPIFSPTVLLLAVNDPGSGYKVGDIVTISDGSGGIAITTITGIVPSGGVTLINSTDFSAYAGGGYIAAVNPEFGTPGNYPACGTLYQGRLILAGTDNNPTQVNGSVEDDYTDFICDPNQDDYGLQFTLVSNKLDQILNAIGSPNALLLGSAGGVWVMAGSNGESLSQTNVNASKQSTWGVSALQPQQVGDYVLFVSRSARIVLMIAYNFVTNQWDNFDLTRLNRNITLGPSETESGIVQTAFQFEPYPIWWAVRTDGQLIGLVFNQQDQVFAWFRVNMLPEGGQVESVAVISGQNQEDQVAIIVNRTIDGVAQRYFEYFMPQELFGDLSNAFFVHCGQQWQGLPAVNITGISNANPCVVTAPGHGFSTGMQVKISGVQGMTQINQDQTQAYTITVIDANNFSLNTIDSTAWGVYTSGGTAIQVTNQVTGMSYLLGQTVVAVGDGALILQPTAVTSDTVTFPYYANLITIGLPYKVTIQPTNPVVTTSAATTRGMKQKLNRATLSLYQSMGGWFGVDPDHLYPITYGPGSFGQLPGLFTGEVTRDPDADWDDGSTFYIEQEQPFPFTLRGLVMRLSYNPD